MTDIDLPREAVEAAIRAHHNFVLGEDVPLTKREIGIEFQAWHAALTAALPHIAPTLPSVEDVRDEIADHPIGGGHHLSMISVYEATEIARAVLALLPRRTETVVKAEALREVAGWLEHCAARLVRGEES